jgi:hypothetical protein
MSQAGGDLPAGRAVVQRMPLPCLGPPGWVLGIGGRLGYRPHDPEPALLKTQQAVPLFHVAQTAGDHAGWQGCFCQLMNSPPTVA